MTYRTEVPHSTVADYENKLIHKDTPGYYERNTQLQTLEGQRTGPIREVKSKDTILFIPDAPAHVYATKFSSDGPVIEEARWRAAGRTVYEEVTWFRAGKLHTTRVEVFPDGQWAEVEWETGKRKHT